MGMALIRYPRTQEGILYDLGLRLGTIQHCKIVKRIIMLPIAVTAATVQREERNATDHLFDTLHHKFRFCFITARPVNNQPGCTATGGFIYSVDSAC